MKLRKWNQDTKGLLDSASTCFSECVLCDLNRIWIIQYIMHIFIMEKKKCEFIIDSRNYNN